MGWLFSDGWPNARAVRDDLRDSLKRADFTIVADALTGRGRRYYAATKSNTTGVTTIFVALIEPGRGGEGWGYKDMDESSGPYGMDDCPLKVLDAADPIEVAYADYAVGEDNGRAWATRWRADVRKYHALRKAAASAKPGDTVVTKGGRRYTVTRHLRRSLIGADTNGREWRLPAGNIAAIEPVAGNA